MDTNKNTWVEIFCDGACSGNPGPGGYGAILKYGDIVREISGCDPDTTNNRMEMMAVIEALRQVKRSSRIRVTTDSNYVVKGMTQWVSGWKKMNWINSQKKPVMNRDLWETILELGKKHEIDWKWIRGHAGHAENERCDALARQALKKCRQKSADDSPRMNDEWIETIRHMTYGIYIVTSRHEEQINGMIASWVSQISYDPPLVMIAVHPKRYTHKLIDMSDAFALHILSKDQKDLLKRFKGPDPRGKFKSLEWSQGKTGSPILKRCLAFLDCKVVAKYRPGNHTLFIGHILDGQILSTADPLDTSDYEGVYIGKD